MSNLPFVLPECSNPATVRLEVYSPADEPLNGSLDASAYACDAHTIDAVTAIQEAGFTARRVPMAPDTTRTCGHVYLFPSGSLAGNACPRWCDETECARRGEHRSPVADIDTNRPEPVIVNVVLVQALDDDASPQVAITAADTTSEGEPRSLTLLLSISQGYVLSNRMRLMTEAVRRDNGGLR
ncbi:hypothetical protein JNW91_24115 [Micromonospora sp. STR1_7]|uniref:Uncharacterized protein n=1 Tax=Micromonospora parastrephiae TaxID=2806101 RepID=A0ABS1XZE7_9ACTN|nr:hypothetical protein [Micromonospora parastrephiae]MBM0234638.1 hypothetical protein [Micromonospora parastrephiae]